VFLVYASMNNLVYWSLIARPNCFLYDHLRWNYVPSWTMSKVLASFSTLSGHFGAMVHNIVRKSNI
jgi:hypothetical protein